MLGGFFHLAAFYKFCRHRPKCGFGVITDAKDRLSGGVGAHCHAGRRQASAACFLTQLALLLFTPCLASSKFYHFFCQFFPVIGKGFFMTMFIRANIYLGGRFH